MPNRQKFHQIKTKIEGLLKELGNIPNQKDMQSSSSTIQWRKEEVKLEKIIEELGENLDEIARKKPALNPNGEGSKIIARMGQLKVKLDALMRDLERIFDAISQEIYQFFFIVSQTSNKNKCSDFFDPKIHSLSRTPLDLAWTNWKNLLLLWHEYNACMKELAIIQQEHLALSQILYGQDRPFISVIHNHFRLKCKIRALPFKEQMFQSISKLMIELDPSRKAKMKVFLSELLAIWTPQMSIIQVIELGISLEDIVKFITRCNEVLVKVIEEKKNQLEVLGENLNDLVMEISLLEPKKAEMMKKIQKQAEDFELILNAFASAKETPKAQFDKKKQSIRLVMRILVYFLQEVIDDVE